MSLATLNVEEEDKAEFLKMKLKFQATIGKELSQAQYFKHILNTHKRGGV